jgi:hypothetical protein
MKVESRGRGQATRRTRRRRMGQEKGERGRKEKEETHLGHDDLLHSQQPRPPLPIRHSNLPHILDLDPDEREIARNLDPQLHALLINDEDNLDLLAVVCNLDGELLVVPQLLPDGRVGVAKDGELVVDEKRREVAGGKGLDGAGEGEVLERGPVGADG